MLLSNPWDVSFVCLVPDIPALLSYKRYRNFPEIVRKKNTETLQKMCRKRIFYIQKEYRSHAEEIQKQYRRSTEILQKRKSLLSNLADKSAGIFMIIIFLVCI